MTRVRTICTASLLGAAALVTGCDRDGGEAQKEIEALRAARTADSTYMAENARWLQDVAKAICNLETVNATVPNFDAAARLCPGNGPGDVKAPPKYPPGN